MVFLLVCRREPGRAPALCAQVPAIALAPAPQAVGADPSLPSWEIHPMSHWRGCQRPVAVGQAALRAAAPPGCGSSLLCWQENGAGGALSMGTQNHQLSSSSSDSSSFHLNPGLHELSCQPCWCPTSRTHPASLDGLKYFTVQLQLEGAGQVSCHGG